MTTTKKPFHIGIAGLGTVGAGVVKLLQDNKDIISNRAGCDIEIISVIAGDKNKDRGVDLSPYEWASSLSEMAQDNRLDVVLEMIGGSEGDAKDFVVEALKNQKHVVTANKALLAHHGYMLSQLAEENGVTISYEAAVAGGIPIIKALREGLAGNKIQSLYGILNGTCNYILSEMRDTGKDFDVILKEAQEQGYAEADPSFDVDGIDAAHKLVLLGALAFGVKPDFNALEIEGISHLTVKDIKYAEELGYRIKLIGMAQYQDGEAVHVMAPCFIPKKSAIANVEGVFNAVMLEGDYVGKSMLEGRGAGEGPTASSVVADVIDLAKGNYLPAFGMKTEFLKDTDWQGMETLTRQYYIHLHVKDDPGVIADVTACLKDKNISIDSFIQKGHEKDGSASLAIMTQEAPYIKVKNAVKAVRELSTVLDKPTILRVENI